MLYPPGRDDPHFERFAETSTSANDGPRDADAAPQISEVPPVDFEPDLDEPEPEYAWSDIEVRVDPDATAEIVHRGGRLFLWHRPVSRDFGVEELDYEPPSGVSFSAAHIGGIELNVQRNLPPPRHLRVVRRRVPPRIAVYWDGARWGFRGKG